MIAVKNVFRIRSWILTHPLLYNMAGGILCELGLLLLSSVIVLPPCDLKEPILIDHGADRALSILGVEPPALELDNWVEAAHTADLAVLSLISVGKVVTLPDSGALRGALHNLVVAARVAHPSILWQICLINIGRPWHCD